MRTLRLVAGSIVVYAIVACGSAAMGPSFGDVTPDASAPRATDAASMGAALADALANPVSEAAAQTLAPITATENCDKMATVSGGAMYAYAEHAFPGHTSANLLRCRLSRPRRRHLPLSPATCSTRQSRTSVTAQRPYPAVLRPARRSRP